MNGQGSASFTVAKSYKQAKCHEWVNEYTECGIIYAYMEYNSVFSRDGILLHVLSWMDGFEGINKRQLLYTFIYMKWPE